MKDSSITVGLDVHKETIVVGGLPPGRERVTERVTIENQPKAIEKLVKRLALNGVLHFVYEAGPCGYEVQKASFEDGTPLQRDCSQPDAGATWGPGEDGPARCREAGPALSRGGADRDPGSHSGGGIGPGSGPRSRGCSGGSVACPAPLVQVSSAIGAGVPGEHRMGSGPSALAQRAAL